MKLKMLEQKLNELKINTTQLNLIKGGDDKRGGFPGKPPGDGTHSQTNGL